MKEINFDNEILLDNENIGKLILLTERPSGCAIKTCLNAMNLIENSYLFDLDGETDKLKINSKNIDYTFYSSVELVNKIYDLYKNNNTNLFIINNWKLIENKEDWFIHKLFSFIINFNIKIIVIDIFPRIVDNRKLHLPLKQDFIKLNNLSKEIQTEKIYCINYSTYYNKNETPNKISYFKY